MRYPELAAGATSVARRRVSPPDAVRVATPRHVRRQGAGGSLPHAQTRRAGMTLARVARMMAVPIVRLAFVRETRYGDIDS